MVLFVWRIVLVSLKPIRYVYMETTNYCNLRCSFCNREDVIGKLQHMPIEKWERLLHNLSRHPIEEAKLMGMGEPFLHPKFGDVCRLFKQYFPNAKLIVATNCQYRLQPQVREALKYIDLLYFSIDGFEDSYEKYRAPAKWHKLITFLDEFKEAERYNCKVTCNYVVNTENIEDIQKVYDHIVVPYGLEELRLNIAQDWSEDSSINDTVGGYTQEQIQYLKDNWQENIKGKSEWDYSDCFWPQHGLYTTVEGRVLMCALNTGAREFGNLFMEDIDRIRGGDEYSAVRSGCETNNPTKHCKNCSYKELAPLLAQLGVHNEDEVSSV